MSDYDKLNRRSFVRLGALAAATPAMAALAPSVVAADDDPANRDGKPDGGPFRELEE